MGEEKATPILPLPAVRAVRSRGPNAFRQRDVTRALKGAQAARVEVSQIKITKDGITLITGKPSEMNGGDGSNPWDAEIERLTKQ
jgi:hypothetical protein